ncbi:hypothetical protein ES705_31875 [subsurface metagenome]|jgi:hypothetical protein
MSPHKPPWTVNGQTHLGLWRIDSLISSHIGQGFLRQPVALVSEKSDADLIVELANRFHPAVVLSFLDENSGE